MCIKRLLFCHIFSPPSLPLLIKQSFDLELISPFMLLFSQPLFNMSSEYLPLQNMWCLPAAIAWEQK